MSEATPGPWIVRQFPTAAYARPQWWVMDSIPDKDGKVIANAICVATATNPDAEANARLIAAAPCLLTSLTELVANLLAGARFGLNDAEVVMLKKAETALAKARGQ